MKKKKQKPGTKLKYGCETMVSAIRHPKDKNKEVKLIHKQLKEKFEKEYGNNKKQPNDRNC